MSTRNLDAEDEIRRIRLDKQRAITLQASDEFRWFAAKVQNRRDHELSQMASGLCSEDYWQCVGAARAYKQVLTIPDKEESIADSELATRGTR